MRHADADGMWCPTRIDCIYEQHGGCLIRDWNCLPFADTCVQPRVFGGVRFAHCFGFFVLSNYVSLRS